MRARSGAPCQMVVAARGNKFPLVAVSAEQGHGERRGAVPSGSRESRRTLGVVSERVSSLPPRRNGPAGRSAAGGFRGFPPLFLTALLADLGSAGINLCAYSLPRSVASRLRSLTSPSLHPPLEPIPLMNTLAHDTSQPLSAPHSTTTMAHTCRWGILATGASPLLELFPQGPGSPARTPEAPRFAPPRTGWISTKFVLDLLADPSTRDVSDVRHEVVAVGSRSRESAAKFVESVWKEAGVTEGQDKVKTHGSYDELFADAVSCPTLAVLGPKAD